MPQPTTLKAPSWVAADDLFGLLRQDLQMKLAYYDSQCRGFEQKHKQRFADYETTLKSKSEDFAAWEDFMDWETAEVARQELTQRLNELAAWKT